MQGVLSMNQTVAYNMTTAVINNSWNKYSFRAWLVINSQINRAEHTTVRQLTAEPYLWAAVAIIVLILTLVKTLHFVNLWTKTKNGRHLTCEILWEPSFDLVLSQRQNQSSIHVNNL